MYLYVSPLYLSRRQAQLLSTAQHSTAQHSTAQQCQKHTCQAVWLSGRWCVTNHCRQGMSHFVTLCVVAEFAKHQRQRFSTAQQRQNYTCQDVGRCKQSGVWSRLLLRDEPFCTCMCRLWICPGVNGSFSAHSSPATMWVSLVRLSTA